MTGPTAGDDREPSGDRGSAGSPGGRRRTVFPGFADLSDERGQLAADLSAVRKRLGLSQTTVAARMGTSQSAVARLEAGDADARLSTLQRYADALGARLAWDLAWQDGEPPATTVRDRPQETVVPDGGTHRAGPSSGRPTDEHADRRAGRPQGRRGDGREDGREGGP